MKSTVITRIGIVKFSVKLGVVYLTEVLSREIWVYIFLCLKLLRTRLRNIKDYSFLFKVMRDYLI